jgi:pimeloyl-ACP methyl ester carboxylesterase
MSKTLPKIVGSLLNILSFFSSQYAATIALNLFSKPRKGQITAAQSAFLETASKKILQYNNQNIMTYQWYGKKETVLLIHGWESNAGRWNDLITELQKKDFNIITLDAPAHGNSGSDFFNVVLYSQFINVIAKETNPNIIVAHSLGGLSTVFSITKHPIKSIHKLVLLGAPSEFKDVLSRYNNMMNYNKIITLKLNAIITERFGTMPEAISTSKSLKNFNLKGLIMHDKEDDIIPYNDALQINKSLKNSKLIITHGLGHSLKDKLVSSHILEFIDA